MQWRDKSFDELTTTELYDFLKLRVDVFVVEQTCYYPELDDLDRLPETRHVMCYEKDELIAYLRILPKGTSYKEYIAIGRVVLGEGARGKGLSHQLLSFGIEQCEKHFGTKTIKISAQEHLLSLYQKHGFKQITEMYLEDGIPHIGMLKEA